MKNLIFFLCSVFLLLQTGCGTIINHTYGHTIINYGGTRGDIVNGYYCLMGTKDRPLSFFWVLFFLVDTPISVVGDSLLFPIDYFYLAGKHPLFYVSSAPQSLMLNEHYNLPGPAKFQRSKLKSVLVEK